MQKLGNKKKRKIKIKTKQFKQSKKHNKKLAPAKPVISKRTSDASLNINYYSAAEGVYASYWVGKLINTLQRGGHKKTAALGVYKAFNNIKILDRSSPLLLFLEMLDKIKPSFRLRNYIVRRTIIKEYPIVAMRPRQLILAVHWLKEELQSSSSASNTSLDNKLSTKLLDFRLNAKKSGLTKKRNEYIKRTVKAQFNIRYNFK